MSCLSISRAARQDLKESLAYVARDKPIAARRLRLALERVFAALARHPFMGELRPDLGHDIRGFSFGNYAVFYCRRQDKVVIARVIHAARDMTGLRFLEF